MLWAVVDQVVVSHSCLLVDCGVYACVHFAIALERLWSGVRFCAFAKLQAGEAWKGVIASAVQTRGLEVASPHHGIDVGLKSELGDATVTYVTSTVARSKDGAC